MWGEVGAAQPPARWGAPPGEYTEWKYRALVWWLMHGRATCACCQQCCWLPSGVPSLPEALLWGFVFVGSQSAVGYPQCLHSLSVWAGTAQAKDKEQGTEGMLLQSLAFSQALA